MVERKALPKTPAGISAIRGHKDAFHTGFPQAERTVWKIVGVARAAALIEKSKTLSHRRKRPCGKLMDELWTVGDAGL